MSLERRTEINIEEIEDDDFMEDGSDFYTGEDDYDEYEREYCD